MQSKGFVELVEDWKSCLSLWNLGRWYVCLFSFLDARTASDYVYRRLQHQLASRCLALAPNLRYVHVNYPLQAQLQTPAQGADAEEQDSDPDSDNIESEFLPVLSPQDALAVIQYCSDALVLFGCNTRVWRVRFVLFVFVLFLSGFVSRFYHLF